MLALRRCTRDAPLRRGAGGKGMGDKWRGAGGTGGAVGVSRLRGLGGLFDWCDVFTRKKGERAVKSAHFSVAYLQRLPFLENFPDILDKCFLVIYNITAYYKFI